MSGPCARVKVARWAAVSLVFALSIPAVLAQTPTPTSAAPSASAPSASASASAPGSAPRVPAQPKVVPAESAAPSAPFASALPDGGPDAPDANGPAAQDPDAATDALPADAADAGDVADEDASDAAMEAAAAAPSSSTPALPASALPVPPVAPPPAHHEPIAPSIWTAFPLVPETDTGDPWSFIERIFPALPAAGGRGWFAYAVLALIALGLATLAGRARRRLPLRGLIPRALAAANVGGRALAVVLGVVMVLRWLPASLGPALPWVVLAAAAAAGWSARDLLPDVFASVVLLVERKVRAGVWLEGQGFRGEVESLGMRAIRLRGVDGRLSTVPNRKLLEEPLVVDSSRHVAVEVVIRPPEGLASSTVRGAIEDAALLSPWRDLQERPEVRRDADDPRIWRVRVRLIEPRFLQAFESALVDHVEESLMSAMTAAGPAPVPVTGDESA